LIGALPFNAVKLVQKCICTKINLYKRKFVKNKL
jgi:hypothetical protein